jgi:4-carboxymuconolactone decarboxylase
MAETPNRPEYQGELFARGLEVRKEVLGAEYVERSLASADDFMAAFQQFTTELAWGKIWTRPGLPRKARSMLNIAILATLGKPHELKLHARAALTNGVTREEIKEVLLQVCVYCGIPAGFDAFRTVAEAFREVDAAAAGQG